MLRLAWLNILPPYTIAICMHSCFLHGILVRQQFHLNKGYTSPTALRPAEICAVHVRTAKFVQKVSICILHSGVSIWFFCFRGVSIWQNSLLGVSILLSGGTFSGFALSAVHIPGSSSPVVEFIHTSTRGCMYSYIRRIIESLYDSTHSNCLAY